MKTPAIRTYLLGNPLSLIGCWGVFAYAGYRCFIGDINPVLPVLTFLLAAEASRCAVQIGNYHRWRREWNAMQGHPQRAGFSLVRIPGLRPVLGVIIWAVVASYVAAHRHDAAIAMPSGCFWLATLLVIVFGVGRLIRRVMRASNKPSTSGPLPVKVCVAQAIGSPSVATAFASLPGYCAPLLATVAPRPIAATQSRS